MKKKSYLKNAFDNNYLNIKIPFGNIEIKPNVYYLDVCKLFKDWSLIYMKILEIILEYLFFHILPLR